jgi:hypothetical protein
MWITLLKIIAKTLGIVKKTPYLHGMEGKLLKKGKNMAKNKVFHNSLIINTLEKTTKYFPKCLENYQIFRIFVIYQTIKTLWCIGKPNK